MQVFDKTAGSILLALFAFLAGCTTVSIPDVPPAHPDPWRAVLAEQVDASGAIDFAALRANPRELTAAARRVADGEIPQEPHEALAFYINGYNTLAMYHAVTSKHRPEQTARFFAQSKLPFAGETISLYALENHRIRPLGDPRIHFALNCMVRSCPRLPATPFQAKHLDEQLDRATREFVNQPRHLQVDARAGVVRLSRIFKWYRKDFGPDLVGYINRYRREPIPSDLEIEWLPYDWRLNTQDSR